MALTNHADLVAAMASRLNRTDLTALLPDFVVMFEAQANRLFRTPEMVTTVSPFAVSSRFTNLPADFLEAKRVTSLYQGQRRQLQAIGTEAGSYYDPAVTSGPPRLYAIVGDQIEVLPGPGGSQSLELTYFARIPALVGGANWLMTSHPDVYLYGSLIHAAVHMQDQERTATYKGAYDQAATELMRASKRAQYGRALQVRVA